jgi:PAS domain S-box-containing protein
MIKDLQVVEPAQESVINNRFETIMLLAPVALVVLKGNNYLIEIANDAFRQIFDSETDFSCKSLLDFIPAGMRQNIKAQLDDRMQKGVVDKISDTDLQLLNYNSTVKRHFDLVCQPLFENGKAASGMIVVANEVIPPSELYLKIKESEERFRSMADNIPLHVFITAPDAAASISYWNKQWLNYTGQRLEEALGETWNGVMHPEDLKLIMDISIPAFENRQPYVLPEIRVKRHDGLYRWHMVKANPRYLPNGEFMGYIGIGIDIHDSKMAQDALTLSESHFRKMTDLMPAKISNANASGDVNFFNKHWLDYSGMNFTDLKEFGYHKIMHPDEIAEFQKRFQVAAETGNDLEMEMRFKNKDGDYKWHLNMASPIKDENGKIYLWVGVTTEIQKMKDEELRKGDFIKMISHELKTPVTSIKGYVQTLLMMLDIDGEKIPSIHLKSSLARIDKQILNLTRLISEMLDLSRIEADSLQMKMEFFSLNNLVDEITGDILVTQPRHTIKLNSDFTASVYADRDRIGQVLINFINNAIKYSPSTEAIEIRVFRQEHNKVGVSVKDFGIGISKDEQQKIFERFYRVGGRNEQTFPGFGIGLFIANSIIEKHSGTIFINSEKDKGSEFIFVLNISSDNNQ